MSGIAEPQLLQAAARAASLDDRLDGAAGADTDPGVITGRLSQWRDNAAGGDAARFRDYLADLGLAQDDAERLVCDVVVPRAEQAPAWSHTLAAITARAAAGGDAGDPAAAAFGHLWTPAGGPARAAIEAVLTAQQRGLMDAGAIDHLVTDLVAGLGELGAAVLYQDFSRLRRRLRQQGRVAASYQQFVDGERQAGLPALVTRYPVLGRLVAQRVTELADAAITLLARLLADLPALRSAFWAGADPGLLMSVRLGWSDRHQHGQTVARLDFERGQVLAYKPRPVTAERALSGLLEALAASGVQTPLAPGVVARDGYGWAAWIEQRPCAGPAELASFYRRSGTLLSLAATLSGTDLIMDNLVAAGPAPALVDAEMLTPPRLAAPELAPAGLVPADAVVQADLEQSVIDTGMLPWWIGGTDGGARDVSGLAGRPLARGPVWLHRNSADMIPVIEPRPAPRARNAPAGGDIALGAARHAGDLIAGYGEAHRWLGTHAGQAADLVGSCGLFSAASRYTFRSTGAYDLIARRAGAPKFLGSGIDRSLALEVLANPASWSPKLARLHARDPAAARAVIRAERLALERLDIPLFLAPATATDLMTERGAVGGVFRGQPAADLRTRLAALTSEQRAEQVLYLRGCFEARGLASPPAPGSTAPGNARPPGRRGPAGAAEALQLAARRCAELIARRAVRAAGSASWVVVGENHVIRARQVRPIGWDLYSGRAGLGIFLAAAAAQWADPALADLARACLGPVPDLIAVPGSAGPDGALTGAPSAIYGLALAADLLGDDDLARGARQAVASLAADAAAGEGSTAPAWDLASGGLGAALALAAASGHGAGPGALTAAEAFGKQALGALEAALGSGALTGADGPGPDRPGPGVAHGALGAALALSRLQVDLGDDRYAEAADSMIDLADRALARAHEDPAAAAGLRQGLLAGSWCAGTAGVAAACMELGLRETATAWPERVASAVRSAAGPGPAADASLCCGRAGAAELLLLAGRPDAARDVAQSLVPGRGGGWAVGIQPGVAPLLPGFHRGLAGLGYTFLRACEPSRFPSVLTWR